MDIDYQNRVQKALEVAFNNGGYDGSHHKMWTIDQMVRILTGCPIVVKTFKDYNGVEYTAEVLGESEEYNKWVATHNDGEDGPDTYEWDCGIAP